jgi:hypothetical protein
VGNAVRHILADLLAHATRGGVLGCLGHVLSLESLAARVLHYFLMQ